MRLYFCTDVHGSEICFRKFLHAGSVYEAGTVIMGGDCTGKMIIPCVETAAGSFRLTWAGRELCLPQNGELAEVEKQIRNSGMYPVRVSEVEARTLEEDPDQRSQLFSRVMLDTLAGWLQLAEERLAGSGLHVIFTPGNDDEWPVDDVLASSDFVEAAEGRVIRVGPRDDSYEMLSLGWANPTPWDTPRECSEDELMEKIVALAEQLQEPERSIFNIHVPPYGTGLDEAPELEDGTRLKRGGAISKAVGSTAVRDAIARYQPVLSLHGHIHESRNVQNIGRTVCINPGSVYSDWELQGVVVDLEDGQVKRYVPTTG